MSAKLNWQRPRLKLSNAKQIIDRRSTPKATRLAMAFVQAQSRIVTYDEVLSRLLKRSG
jgi:hypothetical protein